LNQALTKRAALALFAVVILCWGFNWVVTKLLVQTVSPMWMTAIRSAIALVVLFGLTLATGDLRRPQRGDLPVVVNIAMLHMTGFAVLMGIGLQFVEAGRSIVLGFTTPLWVIPGAMLFLGERLTPARALGVAMGLGGLALMFNPMAFDWSDKRALLGNGLLLLAAFCWALSILHIRKHTWLSTPYQLVFWEVLLATCVLTLLAFFFEGAPRIAWDTQTVLLFAYGGVFGVALAYWAMAMVNRSLPAMTTSLGVLATPVVGVLSAIVILDEALSLALLAAMALIIGGIAIGTATFRSSAARR
jgi:drug/metabolite transporter (DMT)-like permease